VSEHARCPEPAANRGRQREPPGSPPKRCLHALNPTATLTLDRIVCAPDRLCTAPLVTATCHPLPVSIVSMAFV
jgi:hypothetical protein